jgi:hypothetical protein
MPIALDFDPVTGLNVNTAHVVVSSDDVYNHIRTLVVHPLYQRGCDKLCDFREGTLRLAMDAIPKMKNLVQELSEELRGGKWAIVVSDDFAYGMGRMFSILGSFSRVEIEIFRDMDDAREWLGLPAVLDETR